MLDNVNKNNCGSSDEMVSFIYGEIDDDGRRLFERHLAECVRCTDEFTAISNARFSVFEWQKDEFANIPTPTFVIPGPIVQPNVESRPAGLFAGLRAIFDFSYWPIAVAASVLILFGIGFVVISNLSGARVDVAANNIVPPVEIPVNGAGPISDVPNAPIEVSVSKDRKSETVQEQKSVKSNDSHNLRIYRNITANAPAKGKRPEVVDRDEKVPALNNYDDTNDRSLRLSDLFDEEVGATR